jgi:hypothetical protein
VAPRHPKLVADPAQTDAWHGFSPFTGIFFRWFPLIPSLLRLVNAVCCEYFPAYVSISNHDIADRRLNMRWFKGSIRTSIYGLLGNPAGPTDSVLESGMEDIREAMLALLEQTGSSKQFANVIRRVRYANDIQGLWYLRGDLMAALASVDGEMAAREKVQKITKMFQGLVPGSLHSRPSPLTG